MCGLIWVARTLLQHQRVPRLEDKLHAPLRRHPLRCSTKHVGVLGLEHCESRVVMTCETKFSIRHANNTRCSSVPSRRILTPSTKRPSRGGAAQHCPPWHHSPRAACRSAASRATSSAWSACAGRDHQDNVLPARGAGACVDRAAVGDTGPVSGSVRQWFCADDLQEETTKLP
jgi:hypothetical protein